MVHEFVRSVNNGFAYTFDKQLSAGETVIIKMPPVSANKRGINDIGWQSDGEVSIYGTLCTSADEPDTMWSEINDNAEINKTVYALKIVCGGSPARIIIRTILN